MKKIFLALIGITFLHNFAVGDDMGTTVCSTWYKSYLGYLGAIGEPLGVGWVVDIGAQVQEDTCPSDTNVDANINTLSTAIQDITAKVSTLRHDFGSFQDKVANIEVIEARRRFNDRLEKFDDMVDDYPSVYNDGSSNTSSLLDFYEKSIKKDGNSQRFKDLFVNEGFKDALKSTGEQINKFKRILTDNEGNDLNDLNIFYKALEGMCSDPDLITDDVLERRRQCNGIIDSTIAKVMLRANLSKKILNDEINTVLKAVELHDIDEAWLTRTGLKFNSSLKSASQSWIGATAEVEVMINDKIKKMQDAFIGVNGSKKFNPLKGFNAELIKSMKENACTDNYYDDKNYMGYYYNNGEIINSRPRILKWVSTTNDPYIETYCPARELDSDLSFVKNQYSVKSLYYLNGGNTVTNILGNLVSANENGLLKNATDAGPITVSEDTSNDKWIEIKFFLKSVYPIIYDSEDLVTSKLLRMMGKHGGRMGIVNPVTYGRLDNNTWYFDNTITTPTLAEFLVPNPYTDISRLAPNTLFSNIPLHTYDMYFLELGYLAVDFEGIRHSFGLKYDYKHIYHAVGASTHNFTVKLVCLDTNQCQTLGTGIKWRDGNRVELSKEGYGFSSEQLGGVAELNLKFYNKDNVEYKQ